MNKVEIRGTISCFGMRYADMELCLRTPEGFVKVIIDVDRKTASQFMAPGREVYIRGKLMGFDGKNWIKADVVEFV